MVRPPPPSSKASALILESSLIKVTSALGIASSPFSPPPIRTVPPPLVPDASRLAEIRPTLLPMTLISPPIEDVLLHRR